MRYIGGKAKISKPLSKYLNSILKDGQVFIDLFCGSCNVISKIDSNRIRIANDKHFYLIELFKSLQNGWIPPDYISKEEYFHYRKNKDLCPYKTGFIGFGCSYGGLWFHSYAEDNLGKRNYCLNAKNSILKKMKTLQDVTFINRDYKDVEIPKNSFVYCDIPYKNTYPYCAKEVGKFNHDLFYNWVLDNRENFTCYISEYKHNLPDNFKIIWELESRQDFRNKHGLHNKTTEILMTIN